MRDDRNRIDRRSFVRNAALAAGALAAAEVVRAAAPAADVKIGLYSITYGGVWYRGDALTVEQVIGRAKKFGYQGVEIDGKRPHGNPLDMPKARCQQLRKLAADQGLEIYAVAGNNDFSSPIPEHREAQLVYLRELMRMTADLGAKVMRVFLGLAGRDAAARGRRPLRSRPSRVEGGTSRLLRGTNLGLVPREPGGGVPDSPAISGLRWPCRTTRR